ncbi:MAG: 4Fe-4S dicluster domain-containing protein [bacterium]
MKYFLLDKERIKNFLAEASAGREVSIPVKKAGGDVLFEKLKAGETPGNLCLEYSHTVMPPKASCFPQMEPLFRFKDGNIFEAAFEMRKKLLFGIRACDAAGILFTDDFFKRNFEDKYYLSRTENRLMAVAGCRHPGKNCFCASTGTGPYLETGFDLQMVDTGGCYLVETGSEKGEEFIEEHIGFFKEADGRDIETSEKIKSDAAKAVELNVDFKKAVKIFCEDKVPKKTYEKIAEKCIYCGGCVYVCPTCTCFNVFDEGDGSSGIRYRTWDACVFAGYTREASGHNPRKEKWIRTARRYEHKLKYDYLATGTSGCVGCGRCLSACPVNIGMSKVIQEVTEKA